MALDESIPRVESELGEMTLVAMSFADESGLVIAHSEDFREIGFTFHPFLSRRAQS